MEMLQKELGVMDSTASSLCKDNNIDLLIFNMSKQGNITKAVCGENIGTVITK